MLKNINNNLIFGIIFIILIYIILEISSLKSYLKKEEFTDSGSSSGSSPFYSSSNDTVTSDIRRAINTLYQADVDAIRNLSGLAVKLMSTNNLTFPADLNVLGSVTISGNFISNGTNFKVDSSGNTTIGGNLKINGEIQLDNWTISLVPQLDNNGVQIMNSQGKPAKALHIFNKTINNSAPTTYITTTTPPKYYNKPQYNPLNTTFAGRTLFAIQESDGNTFLSSTNRDAFGSLYSTDQLAKINQTYRILNSSRGGILGDNGNGGAYMTGNFGAWEQFKIVNVQNPTLSITTTAGLDNQLTAPQQIIL